MSSVPLTARTAKDKTADVQHIFNPGTQSGAIALFKKKLAAVSSISGGPQTTNPPTWGPRLKKKTGLTFQLLST